VKTDLIFDSSFAKWCLRQPWPCNGDKQQELRKSALEQLLVSFRQGEITSLDGVESATAKAIYEIHGQRPFEMNSHWILSAQDWICPCCGRNKVAISRLGSKGQILGKLTIHHDHMGEAIEEEFCRAFVANGTENPQVEGKRLVGRIGQAFAAHEEVLICEDCNNADTTASRELGLPKHFSFPLGKIRRFILPVPHAPHRIDLDAAQRVWEEARPAYELRMRLISEVAVAAATNTHWYEPHERQAIPIPVYGYANARLGFANITDWLNLEDLEKALGPKEKIHQPNRSRWRTEFAKPGRPLPSHYLAMLRSAHHMAESWDALSEDWRCPGCDRSKYEQVYLGAKGEIQFRAPGTSNAPRWRRQRICNHCHSVVMSMKEEITQRTGTRPGDSFGYFSPGELKGIIRARPHSSHLIKPKEAAALVELAVERLAERGQVGWDAG
jgi:rubredoxin